MTEQVCTCPTNDQGLRVSIDPACRRHPGHKGIGYPDCWCPQDGLIGRLGTAEDCPQHGRSSAAPPRIRTVTCACGASTELELPGDVTCAVCPACAAEWTPAPGAVPAGSWVLVPRPAQFASGGLISGPLPVDGDGALVCLSSGYRLPRDAVERLGGNSAVMMALNNAYVVDDGGPLSSPVEFDRSTADPQPELSDAQRVAVEAIQHEAARQFEAEIREREAMARSWLSARIVEALNGQGGALSIDHRGDLFDALSGEYGAVVLSAGQLDALVDLFVSLLGNPPAFVTENGVTRVEQR